MARNLAFAGGIPSEIDVEGADQLRSVLASAVENSDGEIRFDVGLPNRDPVTIGLTHGVAHTLLAMLRLIGSHQGFQMIPYGAMLSTQEAADLLNVSRPYLIKVIDRGELACEKVGRHRRIKAADLFEYMDTQDSERDRALDEMAKEDERIGLL